MNTSFSSTLKGFGNNTGIEVPEQNVAELGSGKRPPVTVTVNGFTYKSTLAVMGGKYMISFPKANREKTCLKAGDPISVKLVLDEGVREVAIPPKLRSALTTNGILPIFEALSYSKRKEFVRQVNDAKTEETRERRIEKIISALQI